MEKLKRYIIFLIGLFINSLGVSLITKADLGTSPISAIPYVLSLNFPLTLGQFTIIFSILLILIQLCILRKNFKPEHFLQIPISILFGYFIDLTMILLGFVNPQTYPVKVISLLIGCVILGFGVYTEVLANVAMLPGESFVRAVSSTWKTEFGITKISFDVSLTVIAGVLSFLFSGRLHGVREGTIIAALLVGFLARLFGRALHFLEPALFGAEGRTRKNAQSTAEQPCPSEHRIHPIPGKRQLLQPPGDNLPGIRRIPRTFQRETGKTAKLLWNTASAISWSQKSSANRLLARRFSRWTAGGRIITTIILIRCGDTQRTMT